MRLLLILPAAFLVLPVHAGDTKPDAGADGKARPDRIEQQVDRAPSGAIPRPQRETVKLSPSIRTSPPRPDESGRMRRVAPPRAESPLQNVPALKDLPPSGGESPGGR